MMKFDLKNLLFNIFQEDKIENEKTTVISQLAIITIKSLMPSKLVEGNLIDYKRFKEELKLLRNYKIDPLNIFPIDIKENGYFTSKDQTLHARLIPIIIANKNWSVIEEEVIKNVLYTTGDVTTLLECLAISRSIFSSLQNEEDIAEDLKQYIINFSQKEFLEKYRAKYKYDVLESNINFEVVFERVRVSLISLLHGIDIGKFKTIKDVMEVLSGKDPKTSIGNIVMNANKDKSIEYDIDSSYKRMGEYILKLRNSRIDPDDLKIKEYQIPDVFQFKEGEVFFHSLLNQSKVIKKETKENSLISLIKTRAGMYLFKRDPFN